jgi:hypothetical protein
VLALWRCANKHTRDNYDKKFLEQLADKIITLALSPFPVRSLEEYQYGRALRAGSNTASTATPAEKDALVRLRGQLAEGGFSKPKAGDSLNLAGDSLNLALAAPGPRRYVSVCEAALAAALSLVGGGDLSRMSAPEREAFLKRKESYVPLATLLPAADKLLLPDCPRLVREGEADHGEFEASRSNPGNDRR